MSGKTTPEAQKLDVCWPQAVAMVAAGHTMPEISQALGVKRNLLFKRLKKAQLSPRLENRPFDTDEHRQQAVALLKQNAELPIKRRLSNAELAKQLSCSVSTVKELKASNGIRQAANDYRYTEEDLREAATKLGFLLQEPVGSIVTNRKIEVSCHCLRRFETLIDSVLRGNVRSCGCLKSYPERQLIDLLESWGLQVAHNDSERIGYEIDVLVPSRDIGIEYCGLHWHGQASSKDGAKDRHAVKARAAEANGVRLITIFEDEWLNKNLQAVGYLKAIFGIGQKRIGARKTKVVELSLSEARSFLEENHIQGAGNVSKPLGLMYENQLLAVTTWRKKSRKVGVTPPGHWSLERFAVRIGYGVTGALSKMMAFFVDKNEVRQIVTFADLRWSQGGVYAATGFKKAARLGPDYTYFVDGGPPERTHKSLFRRSKIEKRFGSLLPDEDEYQAMLRFGYDRIWDCGHDVWLIQR